MNRKECKDINIISPLEKVLFFLYVLLFILIGMTCRSYLIINFMSAIPILYLVIACFRGHIDINKIKISKMQGICILLLIVANIWLQTRAYRLWSVINFYSTIRVLGARLLSLLSVILVYQIIIKKDKIENLFWTIGTVLILFFMFFLPVRIVPDETAHIYTTYRISEMMLGNIQGSDYIIPMRNTDKELFVDPIETQYNEQMLNHYYEMSQNNDSRSYNESISKTSVLTGNDIAYILPAFGVTLGKILGLNGFYTLLLGRLFNTIQYLILCYWAVKLIPFNKLIPFFIALLPMSLQQGMSYSYDSLIISSVLFVTCISLNLYCFKEKGKNSNKILVVFVAMFSIPLILLKGHAYFMIGLFPGILWLNKKYNLEKYIKYFWIFIGLLFGIYIIISCIAYFKGGLHIAEPNNPIAWSNNDQGYTIQYFINHPIELILILARTTIINAQYYWRSSICSCLGWLTIIMSDHYVVAFTLILIMSSIILDENDYCYDKISKSILSYLLFSIIATSYGIILALVLAWTPLEYSIAMGVQGRYFIPVFIFVAICIKKINVKLKLEKNNLALFDLVVMIFFMTSLMTKF